MPSSTLLLRSSMTIMSAWHAVAYGRMYTLEQSCTLSMAQAQSSVNALMHPTIECGHGPKPQEKVAMPLHFDGVLRKALVCLLIEVNRRLLLQRGNACN